VALAARQAGLPATVIMPRWASISKQEATRAYGGEVFLKGSGIAESIGEAMAMVKKGKTFIHPFDDPDIMAGQGTIGLEILEDLEDADIIVVPVGGGGLIAGIAEAAKSLRPATRVIGVQAAACPSFARSMDSGVPMDVAQNPTIADGIAIRKPGEHTFEIIQKKVDQIVLADEAQIASAMVTLLEHKKLLAEGAGAVPIAALLSRTFPIPKGGKIVLVISGGNVDMPLLDRILRRGLTGTGRLMKVSVTVDDSPGALARLLSLIAEHEANVYGVEHRRSEEDVSVLKSIVDLELETRGWEHQRKIKEGLKKNGYL
jgi:threonine dehydratase